MLPTAKDISIEFGFSSPNASQDYIEALIKKGWFKRRSKNTVRTNYKPIFIDIVVTQKKEITVIKKQAKRKSKLKEK
jgi:hypothetical protein